MISSTQQTTTTPQQSVADQAFQEASMGIEDSIANICWFPDETENVVACSSWDSKIHVNQFSPSSFSPTHPVTNLSTIASITTEYPCISLAWLKESRKLCGGAIDGSIYCIDPADNNSILVVGKHDDAVNGVYYLEQSGGVLCSISYDKTMKFWDLRSSSPIVNCQLGAKPVCSDVNPTTMVIGLENEKLMVFDIRLNYLSVGRDPSSYYIDSPLGSGSQLSAVSISKEDVIGIGSYDGRSNLSSATTRFGGRMGLNNIVTFKAHKADSDQPNIKIMYPIHAVGFHPVNKNTFITAGGDGSVYFWDIPLRGKIANISCPATPITAAKFSPNGKFLAYGIGYDWAKGIEGSKSIKPKLRIHTTQDPELSKSL